MAADESVTVKGAPIRSLLNFIDSDLTAAEREQAFSIIPREDAVLLRGAIHATDAIPVHALNALTVAAASAKKEPVEQFAARAGRTAAQDAVRGIYRFFALVLTPAALLAKASQMWRSLYNRGELLVEDQTDTSVTIRLADFPSELAGCSRMTGWIEGLGEMAGTRKLKITHKTCYTRGDKECTWDVRWE